MNNTSNEVIAQRELARMLRPQPFRQSVGEQLVNDLLANNGFLPYGYVPSQALLRRANSGELAKAYMQADVDPGAAVHELRNFPARAVVACSHPLIRVLTATHGGELLADVRPRPEHTAVDLMGAGGVLVGVRRKRVSAVERRDGVRRLLPHNGPGPRELLEQMHAAAPGHVDPWAVVAYVGNGPRGEAGVGDVHFLNLATLAELSAATDGGRVVRVEVLEERGDLWMTPEEFARRLVDRLPDEAQRAVKRFTGLLTTPVANDRPVLTCMGAGRLGVRPIRTHVGTGDLVTGFGPADFCTIVGGLFLRDDVQAMLQTTLRAHCTLTGLVDHHGAPPRLAMVVDPFVSAYHDVRRAHPAGWVDVERLLSDVGALPTVSGLPVVPPELIHPMPPVMVNDVDWPDTGTWTAVNL